MIRTLKNNDYDPKGFIFILSPFMFDCKTNQMTSSCLTVNIDTSITWPILYENINKNKEVFNGMLYHDFSLLKIINIWEKDVTDLLFQWFLLPYEINDKVSSFFGTCLCIIFLFNKFEILCFVIFMLLS